MGLLKKFVSRKLLGTIVGTLVVVFGLPLAPELQAELVTALWGLYTVAQGYADGNSK